jgi:phosphatidate cytidylyltransferase
LLVLVASGVAASEMLGMTHPGDRLSQIIGSLLTLGVSLAFYQSQADPRLLPTTLVVATTIGLLLPLYRVGDLTQSALRISALIAVPLYIGLLFCSLALVRRDFEQGSNYVLMTLMFAWLGDTGGYLAGRFFGKTPLHPQVSPKKTREGLFGAVAGAMTGGLLAHFWYLPSIPLPAALGLGLFCGLLGQLGDLAESLIKRSANAKDSGWIIPGHGGLLDRVDALLLVSPAVYLYLIWR